MTRERRIARIMRHVSCNLALTWQSGQFVSARTCNSDSRLFVSQPLRAVLRASSSSAALQFSAWLEQAYSVLDCHQSKRPQESVSVPHRAQLGSERIVPFKYSLFRYLFMSNRTNCHAPAPNKYRTLQYSVGISLYCL